MRTDEYYPSHGEGEIHCCRWTPQGEVKAVLQIVHGIAEYAARYDDFAEYLNRQGILVVAQDHMCHGKSIGVSGTQGYFAGGWFAAVADTYQLMKNVQAEMPGMPYFILGHSMGSFLTRTLLAEYPDCGVTGAIICGTGWLPNSVLHAGIAVSKLVCRIIGERNPSEMLQKMVFGGYNQKVEHPRTAFDWLNRDDRAVDAYVADPLCGFTASCGLLRDMMLGIRYNQKQETLRKMKKDLPVFFIAGGDDPVGSYGKGVRKAAQAFEESGMAELTVKIYPLCRHEILNEINKQDIYQDVYRWILKKMTK